MYKFQNVLCVHQKSIEIRFADLGLSNKSIK